MVVTMEIDAVAAMETAAMEMEMVAAMDTGVVVAMETAAMEMEVVAAMEIVMVAAVETGTVAAMEMAAMETAVAAAMETGLAKTLAITTVLVMAILAVPEKVMAMAGILTTWTETGMGRSGACRMEEYTSRGTTGRLTAAPPALARSALNKSYVTTITRQTVERFPGRTPWESPNEWKICQT